MLYLIFVIVIIIGIYFAFRYISMIYALREMNRELQDLKKDVTQNHILHLPIPNRNLGDTICLFNDTLDEIRKEWQKYEEREKNFQKQIEHISHDLRTPLTVILGYLKLIKKESGKMIIDKELKVSLEIIEKKAESMKKLVTEFYDFSRLNADDYELKLDNVDVYRTLRESLMGNYQVLDQSHLEVEVNIPEYPMWVLGNETALERIFSNLLQNSSRYASGFLNITIHEDERKISIFFVNDTEVLSEMDIPYLFDKFYKQDSSRNQGGTGLGLTVAKALAEEMEGSLEVSIIEDDLQKTDINRIVVCFKLCMKRI